MFPPVIFFYSLDFVKTMYIVLLINKVQGFTYSECLSFLNVSFEFKSNFIIQIQVLNSNHILRF
jgi:hypothetical protein